MSIALLFAETKELLARAVRAEELLRSQSQSIASIRQDHQAAVDNLKLQIAWLENINERLLRQIGVEPLADPTSANEPLERESAATSQPASITGGLIARDKKRLAMLRADNVPPEDFRRNLEQALSEKKPVA